MASYFELHIVPEQARCAEWHMHDSRDGLDLLIFGLDAYEDNELLRQVSAAIELDLGFMKFPDGRAFEANYDGAPARIEEGIRFFRTVTSTLRERPDYPDRVTYPYQRDYLKSGKLEHDMQALGEYLECSRANGATAFWFAMGR